MLNIKIFFIYMLLSISVDNNQSRKITVIGKAYDAKRSAVIRTSTGRIYYLDELSSWENKYIGKKVRVTGLLTIEYNKRDNRIQQVEGKVYIIKKAKWILIN